MPLAREASSAASKTLASLKPVDCACSAANGLLVVKLRKLNVIFIACCCILGVGTVSMSSYFIYKLWRLNKKLANLETNVKILAAHLNLLEGEVTSDRETEEEEEEKKTEDEISQTKQRVTRKASRSSSSVSSASDIIAGHKSRMINKIQTEQAICRRFKDAASIKSLESESDLTYRTPATSPDRFSTQSPISFAIKTSTESLAEISKYMDDTDRYLLASDESLKKMCEENELELRLDESDHLKIIEYIKSLYYRAEREINAEAKKEIQFKTFDLAKRCLDVYPDSYLSHKWYAMIVGRIVDYLSMNEKVKNGFDFKKHLDIAINMNSEDYLLYYLRGRWCFKMNNLNWAEKCGVRLLFGKVPEITLDDALDNFIQVEKLNASKSKGNLLYLAKCLIAKEEAVKAVFYLSQAKKLPNRTIEHEQDSVEIEALLRKYSKI